MPAFFNVGGPGAYQAANGGKVSAFNNIGAGAVQIAAAAPQRVAITFHNPGGNDILVYPQTNATGGANAPSIANPGGGFRVFANGGSLTITGECQQAWSALAFAGSNQALTVMETNVS